jgi:exopolysaccharide biosynthesis predicted pyruvyltransferase EpsI
MVQSAKDDHPDDVIAGLRRNLREVFASVLDGCSRIGLVDFPDYGNVGDSAIWVGQVKLLRELGIEIVTVASQATYSQARLRRQLGPAGTIAISGGGNFGDLWPAHQDFRLTLMRDFPAAHILQLPQSLHFRSSANYRQSLAAFSNHGNVTILARDPRSFELAQDMAPNRSQLCPDPALLLEPSRASEPDFDVLLLLRSDLERQCGQPEEPLSLRDGWVLADWPDDPLELPRQPGASRRIRRRMRRWRRTLAQQPGISKTLPEARPAYWNRRADVRLSSGIAHLSGARVVITDRLHGHLLCLVLGLPHVVLDNSYGKVHGFMREWHTDVQNVKLAATLQEARRYAQELLASG